MSTQPFKPLWFAALAGALALAGCATKDYVNQQSSKTNERIEGVESQVESAQVRLKEHDEKISSTSKTAKEALDRAIAAGKLAEGKIVYETVLTDDNVRFGPDRHELSPEAKKALDEFSVKLKEENKGVYIEIQGHTDGLGGEEYNLKLGEARAEAARLYLNKSGGLPLHRMSVISYGKAEPIADNKTREGRAKNRRVALVVLK